MQEPTPSVKAATGLSSRLDPAAAAAEAVEGALAPLAGAPCDAALVLASAAWTERDLALVAATAAEGLDCPAVVGGSFDALQACGLEVERRPAVAVLAVAGVEAEAVFCEGLAGREEEAGGRARAWLERDPTPSDLTLLFYDALELAPEPLLDSLRSELTPASLAGAGASEVESGRAFVWSGGHTAAESLAALVLRARQAPELVVSHGYRLETGPLTVTRARGHWILGIDGRPALDVYRAALRGSLRDDLARAAQSVMVALIDEDGGPDSAVLVEGGAGGLPVRPVVGFDATRSAFSVPEPMTSGRRLALVSVDPAAARQDLSARLAELASLPSGPDVRAPAFGCYFGCSSRGRSLFGHEGLEAGYLAAALRDLPLIGTRGAAQLGPAGSPVRPHLLTLSGVLALFAG